MYCCIKSNQDTGEILSFAEFIVPPDNSLVIPESVYRKINLSDYIVKGNRVILKEEV